jgi:RNA polymerase II subunit A C-terminal domain phosphatase
MKLSATATPNETTDAETISDVDTDENLLRPNGTRLKIIVSGPTDAVGEGQDLVDDDAAIDGVGNPNSGEMSPIDDLKTFDWGSADDELAAFLAEDDDDEGDDGDLDLTDAGESEAEAPTNAKRKHADDVSADGNSAKKIRVAHVRVPSGLSASHTPDDDLGGLPTPQITGDEEDAVTTKVNGVAADNIDEDELEEDMMAELEAEEARDALGGNG